MLTDLKLQKEYLRHNTLKPVSFFRNAICEANFYRRAAGYFSSAVFGLFSEEFIKFVKNGGKIELVCSNQLAHDDADILFQVREEKISENFLQRFFVLEEFADDAMAFFATLLRMDVLTIKIAEGIGGNLFHDKTGCFKDARGDVITFRGSGNETFSGWSEFGNFETLEVFCSWQPADIERVVNHQQYLEAIWNNNIPDLNVFSLSEISKTKIIKLARTNIDDFIPILEKLKRIKPTEFESTKEKKRTLKRFQSETIRNWETNNFKGIIKHATGSGKTVTAISALDQHLQTGEAAIVVVPSVLLLKQWREEIIKDIPSAVIQLCGDGNVNWKKPGRLRNILAKNEKGSGAIILTTLSTMCSDMFMSRLGNVDHVMLIADEVHTLGEKKARGIFDFNFGKRLGLSATPERHLDPEGTQVIFNFFDGILDPVITIEDAIRKGRLVNYLYHPIRVELDEDEVLAWSQLTKKITRLGYTGPTTTPKDKLQVINRLFQKRSNIAKKASGKISAAVSTIRKNFKSEEYWLIYCEDSEQLDEVNVALTATGHYPYIYKTDMGKSKSSELSEYIRNGGIMLSIRCLDEGVDIPRISHAVILASSQNPRQFIQRRGRVLRHDGHKEKAVIYDLFTTPNKESGVVQDSLMRGELARSLEFARSSLNHAAALAKIRSILIDFGLYDTLNREVVEHPFDPFCNVDAENE